MNSNDPDDFHPSLEHPSNGFETVTLELDGSEQEEIGELVMRILNNRREEIEHLCGEFIEADRLTLDDESFEVVNVSLSEAGGWRASCNFTVSAYYGCRDMDVVADERDCVISLNLDLDSQAIILKVPKRIERDTFEEF